MKRFSLILILGSFLSATNAYAKNPLGTGEIDPKGQPIGGTYAANLVDCSDKEQNEKMAIIKSVKDIPLPAKLEFHGEFYIGTGSRCSNNISNCEICISPSKPAVTNIKFTGLVQVKKFDTSYHEAQIHLTGESGSYVLSCKNQQVMDSPLSPTELCNILNVTGKDKKSGVKLLSTPIVQKDSHLKKPGKPTQNGTPAAL